MLQYALRNENVINYDDEMATTSPRQFVHEQDVDLCTCSSSDSSHHASLTVPVCYVHSSASNHV